MFIGGPTTAGHPRDVAGASAAELSVLISLCRFTVVGRKATPSAIELVVEIRATARDLATGATRPLSLGPSESEAVHTMKAVVSD